MVIGTEVRHITPKDGNVFADLGFAPGEAAKLKIKAELRGQTSLKRMVAWFYF